MRVTAEKVVLEVPDEIKNGLEIKALKNVKEALEFALEAHPNFVKDQEIIVPDITWANSVDSPPAA